MTVEAQVFPVAAIGRIVIVIVVLVVYRQLVEVFPGKFPSASRADPGVNPERLFPISFLSFVRGLACFPDYLVQLVGVKSAPRRFIWRPRIYPSLNRSV